MNPISDELAIDDLGELAFQAPERLARRLVLGELALVMVRPGPGCIVWTRAARWSALLSERLPLRDRRWRVTSPLETSIGAVPV